MPDVRDGDWVQVWGQVVDVNTHPEEYTVRIRSHNTDYDAYVLRDRVAKPDVLPGWVEQCTDLFEAQVRLEGMTDRDHSPVGEGDLILLRCTKHHGHGGKHRHRGMTWKSHLSYGYVEER